MKPGSISLRALTALSALFVLLTMTSLQARAIGRLADVTIVDRETGATLPVHYAQGEYWVAGRPGARYAIAINNRLGQRVMAVASVDGINAITGETAAWDQSGYVFLPGERYQITGWRKSNREIAAFEFSTPENAYAGRTGRIANVGVIGVALFRERQPRLDIQPTPQRRYAPSSNVGSAESTDTASRLQSKPAVPAAGPGARSSDGLADAAASKAQLDEPLDSTTSSGAPASAARIQAPLPAPRLGTAHGERETSVVTQTTFNRLQSRPQEVISIRYDSRENLIAAGVIREQVQPLLPHAFPQSDAQRYVPDPPAN